MYESESIQASDLLAERINYSLFILSRYREEREQGLEKLEAISRSSGQENLRREP